MKEKILNEIKSFPSGHIFRLREVFEKFNIEEKDMMKMYENILKKIEDLIEARKCVEVLPYNVPMRKKSEDEINVNAVRLNNDKFDSLDYDFFFEYSLNFGKVKLSQKHFAIITKNPTKLFIIDNEQKTKALFEDFLRFVDSSLKYKSTPKGVKTGIYTKVKWATKLKYLFKKKPSVEETRDFLEKVFIQNGFEF